MLKLSVDGRYYAKSLSETKSRVRLKAQKGIREDKETAYGENEFRKS